MARLMPERILDAKYDAVGRVSSSRGRLADEQDDDDAVSRMSKSWEAAMGLGPVSNEICGEMVALNGDVGGLGVSFLA